MRSLPLVAGLLALLTALAAVLWFAGKAEPNAAEPGPVPIQGEASPPTRGTPLGPAPPLGEAAEPASARAIVGADEPSQDEAGPPVGRINLRDPDGLALEPPSGRLKLIVRDPRRSRVLLVDVEEGAFALEGALRGARLEPGHLEGADTLALPADSAEFVCGDGPCLLEYVRVPDLELTVRSADTGGELQQVRVREVVAADLHYAIDSPELETEVLVEDASSPVTLRPYASSERLLDRGELRLLVDAKGYAPRSVRYALPGVRRVELELAPAGVLELTARGSFDPSPVSLELASERDFWSFEPRELASEGPHRFENLPAGALQVELRIPDRANRSEPLAAERVRIDPGGTTTLDLAFERPAASDRVTFAGTLDLSPGWGSFDPKLQAIRIESVPDGGPRQHVVRLAGSLDEGGLIPFRFEDVYPTRHRIALPALGWQAIVEVPPGGQLDARLRVPPPCRIEVAYFNRRDRAPVQPAFAGATGGDHEPGGGVGANRDLVFEDGVGRVECPAGPLHLLTVADAFGVVEHDLLVEYDGQRFELEVDTAPMLEVRFIANGEPIELPPQVRVELFDEAGFYHPSWSTNLGDRTRIGIETGHPATLRVSGLLGYHPLEERVVESVAGEDVVLTLELTALD